MLRMEAQQELYGRGAPHLPVLKPVLAVVFAELLKGIGQKGHHSTVQIGAYGHDMRKRLAPSSALEQTED